MTTKYYAPESVLSFILRYESEIQQRTLRTNISYYSSSSSGGGWSDGFSIRIQIAMCAIFRTNDEPSVQKKNPS